MISLKFNNTITERDMDLLLAEAVLTDPDFCRLLLDKTDLKGKTFQVLRADLSKSDSDLGESDITVIIESESKKYGLLIEDKIDAPAMPEQHDRYIKRGEKGVKAGDYNGFRVFIFCPAKYYESNKEAGRYEHLLTYEECKEFFDKKKDPLSALWSQQIKQALNKARRVSEPNVNEKANAFLRQYSCYQKEHYPSLDLSTKEDKNGWWTDFRTELGKVYITHKLREGYVDLMLLGASDKSDRARIIAEWANQHKMSGLTVVKAKRSSMIRKCVPPLDIEKGFEFVDEDELNQCFDAIKEFTEFANIIEIVRSII